MRRTSRPAPGEGVRSSVPRGARWVRAGGASSPAPRLPAAPRAATPRPAAALGRPGAPGASQVPARRKGGGLSAEAELSLVGPNGTLAPYVREHVLPGTVAAMREHFARPQLPVLALTSIGKLTPSTAWIIDELQRAVGDGLGARLSLGTARVAGREFAAAAEMHVLLGGQSILLSPGSTFSEFANFTLAQRPGGLRRVAFMPQLLRGVCNVSACPAAEPGSGTRCTQRPGRPRGEPSTPFGSPRPQANSEVVTLADDEIDLAAAFGAVRSAVRSAVHIGSRHAKAGLASVARRQKPARAAPGGLV